MYNRDKILQVMQEIYEESKPIKPYVTIAQPRRDLNETAAQNLDGYEGLHIDVCGFSHAFVNIGGESVDVARNYLIEKAIESDAKYLLFVGEDTVLPYDGFRILHETAEKNPDSMVVGVYYIKLSSPMIMINQNGYIIPANVEPGQIYEAWQTGLDAALIPISLLKKMKEEDPELPFTCIGHKINDLPFIGEDNFFVYRWRKMGYKLLVNTDVQCLHMDLASGKYTAHPSVKLNNYFTNIPITGELTMDDKKYIDQRWSNRLPHVKKDITNFTKINLGCGINHLQGFVNVDINDPADVIMDIRKLDIENNSVEEIVCSHVLEHFADYEVIGVLQEIFRVLKPQGILYLEIPDLEYCVREWLKADENHPEKWNFYLMRIFGNQINEYEFHKTGFTEKRISRILSAIGFKNIEINRINSKEQESLSIKTIKL